MTLLSAPRRWTLFIASFIGLLATASPIAAQPVPSRDPASTHIFPAGGRRGTTLAVRIGGECLPPGTGIRFWGDGVTAPLVLGDKVAARVELSPRRAPTEIPIQYPKEWASEIRMAPDAAPGPVFWRLTCSQGGTGARPFVVGDLAEFVETESNSTLERAERIELPVTVNGQIAGERDLDYYVFSAREADVVVSDVMAGRLGSALDPVVELLAADGSPVALEEVRVGSDPVVAFRVPRTADYILLVSGISFHGSPKHVYRITLSTAPYIHHAFPAGGRAGETREVEFFALSGTRVPRVLKEKVTFPPLSECPTGVFRYAGPAGSPPGRNRLPLAVEELPEALESEPNDSARNAMELALPVTVNGRFLEASDEDWYRFAVQKDQRYTLRCVPQPPGHDTLPILSLVGGDGQVLEESRSVDSATRECRIEWRAPTGGSYLARVRDIRQGARGGSAFIYRLTVREARPDFRLRLASDFVHVIRGKSGDVELTVERLGGFEGAIELSVTGLPEGVEVSPAQVLAEEGSVKLSFSALEDARPTDRTLRVVGRGALGDGVLERVALARHWGVGPDGMSVGSPVIDNLHLTVRHEPVFRLFCPEAYQYAHRGTVFLYPMEIERLAGYGGDIVLEIGDRQNRDLDGVEMLEVTVPPEATAARMPIYLPETMHINVQSQSQLYVQAFTLFTDRWGQKQSQLVVSEKRCMIRPMPTVVKLRAETEEIALRPGESADCRLRLERTSNFRGPMEVRLVEPRREKGFSAEPTTFAADETRAVVRVSAALSTPLSARAILLRFRARGELPGGIAVISETTVRVKAR